MERFLEEAEGVQDFKSILTPPILKFLGTQFPGLPITSAERKPFKSRI